MFKDYKNMIHVLYLSIVLITLSGCINDKVPDNNINGITAMTGRIIADEVAFNWSLYSELVFLTGGGMDSGMSPIWRYSYINSTNRENGSELLDIVVYHNLSYILIERGIYIYNNSINNWTIDSDIAYSIAINNTEISDYLNSTGRRASVESYVLRAGSRYVGNITSAWEILWNYSGALGFGQSHIKIDIDASTGKVLYTG